MVSHWYVYSLGKVMYALNIFSRKLAAARADGTASIFALSDDGLSADLVSEWKETRLKERQRYVGIGAGTRYAYFSYCVSISGIAEFVLVVSSPAHQMALYV